jgi:hypothetical protein
MSAATGGASEPSDRRRPGKAGGTVAVRRTLASTICQIADPTQVPRPRQLRDVSTVMRFRPAHQSMINRRFNDRASCPARKSPKQALARKPRIHSPASGKGGDESAQIQSDSALDVTLLRPCPAQRSALRAARGQALVPGIHGSWYDACRGSWVPTDQVRGLKAHGSSPATNEKV